MKNIRIVLGFALCLALMAGCGAVEDPDGASSNQTTTSNNQSGSAERTGRTPCGSFGEEEIFCNNNQYCADQVLNRCSEGCTSDQNCVEAQVCVKSGGDGVGACQNRQTDPVDPCTQITCQAGQVCQNGACVTPNACANVTCGQGESCVNGACVTQNACANVTCGQGESCVDGTCVRQNTSCQVTLTAQDGCPASAFCVFVDDAFNTACESFPACGAGNSCAPGLEGSICSSEIVQGKDPMCLAGACLTDANCPSNWYCIKLPSDIAGFCDEGRLGSECIDNGDCGAGLTCDTPFPGETGFCTDF